jgi:hypothetical protein
VSVMVPRGRPAKFGDTAHLGFPLASVAQILLWMFDAAENSAFMRSVAVWVAAITPYSVPSCC